MAQVYEVNYSINVLSQQAVQALNQFKAAVTSLNKATSQFTNLERRIRGLGQTMASFNKPRYINIQLKGTKVSTIEKQAIAIERLNAALKANQGTPPNLNSGNMAGGSTKGTATRTVTPRGVQRNNLSYKIFGPSMLDSGGGAAVNMAKGFGIAYGITGLMQGMSHILQQATEYDNITKTTQNILSTNDKLPAFASRFTEMNRVMRQVGVETKFTAAEVASAGKFLAMAGFNTDQITKSIRPISNMALIGDTDLGETADVVTNIMTGYGLSADKLGRVADIMTMTSTNANTTIMEMAEAFKYAAGVLSGSGIQFEEATAAMGILGDAGLKGSIAGTTLRTLMVNFLKPTKMQRANWDKLGVSPLDSHGDIRSMLEVFSELKQKGASTTDLANMFHKTALQGAIALLNNVDKWNAVIAKNFLSESLAQKLAEEKKGTIQGLWAQLTSAFTEDGIKEFAYLQDWIKGLLKGTTEWLKSTDAMKTMGSIVDIIKTAFNGLKNAAVFALQLYHVFEEPIKLYIQFQSIMMPLLVGGRALKSVINLWNGLIKLFAVIKTLSFAVSAMIKGQSAAKLIQGGLVGAAGTMPYNMVNGVANAGASKGARVAGAVSGLLGIESLGLSATALGIGAGAIGLGAAIYGLYRWKKAVDEGVDSVSKWQDAVQNINGIDIKIHASNMTKYLEVVTSGQRDANAQLSTYVHLLRQAAGLTDELGNKANEDTTPFKDAYKEVYDNMDFFASRKMDLFGGLDDAYQKLFDTIPDQYTYKWMPYRGWEISNSDKQDWLARGYLMTQGYSEDAGSKRSELREKYLNDFMTVGSTKDFDITATMVMDKINALMEQVKYKNVTFEQFGQLSIPQQQQTDAFIHTLQISLKNDIFDGGIFTNFINQYREALKTIEENKEFSESAKQNLLYSAGIGFLDPRLGAIFSQQWEKNMGYDRTKPQGQQWGGTVYNVETGKKVTMNAETAMQNMILFFQHLNETLQRMNPTVSSTYQDWLSNPIWSMAGAGASVSGDNKPKRQYNSKTGKWQKWVDDKVSLSGGHWQDEETVTIPHSTNNTKNTKTTPDPYKSHYQNGNAAPKQIIVRIGNLMKVDKIDMADPSKRAAVINNLKSELASALIDVVADFDESMG